MQKNTLKNKKIRKYILTILTILVFIVGIGILSTNNVFAGDCSCYGYNYCGSAFDDGGGCSFGSETQYPSYDACGGTTSIGSYCDSPEAPVITISANPNPIPYNTASAIIWSSTNATSCFATDDWSGSKPISGIDSTGNLTSEKTYGITCSRPGASNAKSVTVSVDLSTIPNGTNTYSNLYVTTLEAEDITYTTAKLLGAGGDLMANPTLPMTAYFRYSKKDISPIYCNDIYGTNMVSTKDIKLSDIGTTRIEYIPALGKNVSSKPFSQNITNLTPDTKYYYCAIISNKENIAYGGSNIVMDFRTSSYKTTIRTSGATSVGSDSAKLNGSYNSIENVTTYFEYKKATASGEAPLAWEKLESSIEVHNKQRNPNGIYEANVSGNINFTLTGLAPVTKYQFRAVATTSSGAERKTIYGTTLSFTTSPIPKTIVRTNYATGIRSDSARLNGSYSSIETVTTYFQYKEILSEEVSSVWKWKNAGQNIHNIGTSKSLFGNINFDLTGLTPVTKYQFRAVATTNSGETFYGSILSFKTNPVSSASFCIYPKVYSFITNGCVDGSDSGVGTCYDGIQNGTETGIDTGGRCGTLLDGSCYDKIKNGDETGVDVGGRCGTSVGTCYDGIQNGNEKDVDTGGRCYGGTSLTGNCYDGIKNGNETGIDTGGQCGSSSGDWTTGTGSGFWTTITGMGGVGTASWTWTGTGNAGTWSSATGSGTWTTGTGTGGTGSGTWTDGTWNSTNGGSSGTWNSATGSGTWTATTGTGGTGIVTWTGTGNGTGTWSSATGSGTWTNGTGTGGAGSGTWINGTGGANGNPNDGTWKSNANGNGIINTKPLVLGQKATPPWDAIVRYHEGIETVFTRQIIADKEFAKLYGYEEGTDLLTFAWDLSHQLAKMFGYVTGDGREIRVSFPDIVAYQLQLIGNKLTVYEYYDYKIVDVRNVTTVFKKASDYEYYFKK